MFGNLINAVKRGYNYVAEKTAAVATAVVGGIASLLGVDQAQAASVLDTSTTTAITAGFTDMKDTLIALLNVAWPFLIAVPVLMMAPRIVSKLVKMIGRG